MSRKTRFKPLSLGDDSPEETPDTDLEIAPAVAESEPAPAAQPDVAVARSVDEDFGALSPGAGQTQLAERRALPPPPAPAKGGTAIYAIAGLVAVLWAGAPIAFYLGYLRRMGPFDLDAFTLVVLGLLVVGPIAMIWIAAYLVNQGARLAAEARLARAQAEDMVRPVALAAHDAGDIVRVIRTEIANAVAAAAQARHELTVLREVLAAETGKLVEVAGESARTAASLTQAIGQEREALATLSGSLGSQVVAVEETLGRQARMVAEASDLAETQLREAEAMLAARAADMAAAASDATEAARLSGEDLARQAARLEAAGAGVCDQIRTVEEGLAEQRATLIAVSHSLRAEQEDFATHIESQQAQLAEILAQAQQGAGALEGAAIESGEKMNALIARAVEQVRDVADAAAEERDLFGAATLQSLGALSEAAAQQRAELQEEAAAAIEALFQAAADSRAATEAQAEATRLKIDQLSEAAFAAGQKADAAYQQRLDEAQRLIEDSVALVEEAGSRAGARLNEGLAAARTAVEQLEQMLNRVETRTAQLPVEAQAHTAEVTAAMQEGVQQMLNAAKAAADETQAIDAAFQERMRRNYEVLSESVRLMGVVGGGSLTPRPPRPSLRPSTTTPPVPTAAPQAAAPQPPPPSAPEPPLRLGGEAASQSAGLRPRLRFTPAPAPPEPPRGGGDVGGEDEWTWKELLSSVDESPSPAADQRAGDELMGEIEALGIDAAALLPRGRIEEIAAVLQVGDQQGAREVVRRLAPAAMRRLSRRILTETGLRASAGRFLSQFEGQIDKAAESDRDGRAMAALLGSDHGRAYLLLDSALGDVA